MGLGLWWWHEADSPEFVSAIAHHEAGHAVAAVLSFRRATWLAKPPPPLLVWSIEITEDAPGQWGDNCFATDIYSVKWGIACIAPRYRDLMEAQVIVELAGGVAEAGVAHALGRTSRRVSGPNNRRQPAAGAPSWRGGYPVPCRRTDIR
jgi:hypothetical protein